MKNNDKLQLIAFLTRYADDFLKENYGIRLNIPIKINGRLIKTMGRFVYFVHSKKPSVIELSKILIENNEMDVILNILKHELVHYALFVLGKPSDDGEEYFENELKRLGIVSQSTIKDITINVPRHVYVCNNCNHHYKVKRRLKYDGYFHRCNHCKGRLTYQGRKVVAV